MELPKDLHSSMASDRARLVRTPSDVVPPARSTNGMNSAPHARVQSQHGVIFEQTGNGGFVPGLAISEEPEGMISASALAAVLDEEEDEEDLGTQNGVMHDGEWYDERSPTSERFFPQSHGQGEISSYQPQHQDPRVAHSSNAQSATLTPPPRSSSRSGSMGPRGNGNTPTQLELPQRQLQPQQFADKPRYALTDSGPTSVPSSPVHPGIRRAVSDTLPYSQSEPSSPSSPSATGMGSGTLTPPMRRGQRAVSGANAKYATFEEMGIQGKGMAQAQAEKDAKDCVIM